VIYNYGSCSSSSINIKEQQQQQQQQQQQPQQQQQQQQQQQRFLWNFSDSSSKFSSFTPHSKSSHGGRKISVASFHPQRF